jgi:hypothetical protein
MSFLSSGRIAFSIPVVSINKGAAEKIKLQPENERNASSWRKF